MVIVGDDIVYDSGDTIYDSANQWRKLVFVYYLSLTFER